MPGMTQPHHPSNSSGAGSSTLSDLVCSTRRTTGQIPPPLVGASTTIIGSRLYLFGGRLVPSRTMMSDLYVLDLDTLVWTRIWPPSEQPQSSRSNSINPQPRYFHSADAWGHLLVIFGGMAFLKNPSKSEDSSSTLQNSSPNFATSPKSPSGTDPDANLCVLSDIVLFDTQSCTWSSPSSTLPTGPDNSSSPSPRYAHLSCISNRCLIIFGGQDLSNHYLQEINVLSLDTFTWSPRRRWEGNFGTYRSVAVSRHYTLSNPPPTPHISSSVPSSSNSISQSPNLRPRTHSRAESVADPLTNQPSPTWKSSDGDRGRLTEEELSDANYDGDDDEDSYYEVTDADQEVLDNLGDDKISKLSEEEEDDEDEDGESDVEVWMNMNRIRLYPLPFSRPSSLKRPEPVWLYSNFNFSSVKRTLDLISAPKHPSFACSPVSLAPIMNAASSILPPGLRFPTASIVGEHLVVCGTCLSGTSSKSSSFAIWALDLTIFQDVVEQHGAHTSRRKRRPSIHRPVWRKIDPGPVLSGGSSWNRAVTWQNSLVILGNRDRDISIDYDHRQTNYLHVALVDLESFGIYDPPNMTLSPKAQRFGLSLLNRLELSDFEFVCSDGQRIACSRKLLEERWPWFNEQLGEYKEKAQSIIDAQDRGRTGVTKGKYTEESNGSFAESHSKRGDGDVRITPRTLTFPESSTVAKALLEYFYTLAICTSHQRTIPTLSSLLSLSRTYNLDHLRALVIHALHVELDREMDNSLTSAVSTSSFTSSSVASSTEGEGDGETKNTTSTSKRHRSKGTGMVGRIYEAATLGGSLALQIRALKYMMSTSRSGKDEIGRTRSRLRSDDTAGINLSSIDRR